MKLSLKKDWYILQDVHDDGEALGLYKDDFIDNVSGTQISEWEPLPELKQLQLLFAKYPYFGRELRYFNEAPWWYKNTFNVPQDADRCCKLWFTNVDYYCKVWINGRYVGEHEGYSAQFGFDVEEMIKPGETNTLIVKVWSPWDGEVRENMIEMRTFLVSRNMVKGTYEHSDTLLQRDANPVGIYGEVYLDFYQDVHWSKDPDINYDLDVEQRAVSLQAAAKLEGINVGEEYTAILYCVDHLTKETVGESALQIVSDDEFDAKVAIKDITLWSTWDRGTPYLYDAVLDIFKNGVKVLSYAKAVGFRKVEMLRDEKQTAILLNGKRMYVRGTSYFPDQYVSAMHEERYWRDLLAIKNAGFNLLRVHVHIEFPIFYHLCDELGIAIIQDSEYNWMHPFETDFTDRFISVYTENIIQMKNHPSIFVWVCMNEPGVMELMLSGSVNQLLIGAEKNEEEQTENLLSDLGASFSNCEPVLVHPGPAIMKAVRKADPSRPIILGSFCSENIDSGDSHNYTGSLNGEHTHFLDLYGKTEKFNSEYGFDALPCKASLQKNDRVYHRLKGLEDDVKLIQEYQYKYLKYVTEHYRLQKYKPCSGYVHFLFNDTSPTSFYGLMDWYGLPKKGLAAMLESNMPVAVMVKFGKESIDGIYLVNDYLHGLGQCTLEWTIVFNKDRKEMGKKNIEITQDSLVLVEELNISRVNQPEVDIYLVLKREGKILTTNHYEDIFNQPEHVKGHPHRMNHELGCRLYWC